MEERIGLALTGHRPPRLAGYDLNHPFYQNLQATLESLIERALLKYQVVDCHSGMALGADTIWSLAILACQDRHGSNRVRFHAKMPNKQHGSNWPAKSQAQHAQMVSKSQSQSYYEGKPGTPFPKQADDRNKGMVDKTDIFFCCLGRYSKGRYMERRKIRKRNRQTSLSPRFRQAWFAKITRVTPPGALPNHLKAVAFNQRLGACA